MEKNLTVLIKPDLIKSTSKNLIWIGYLIIFSILFSCIMFYQISNERNLDDIKLFFWWWWIVSIILLLRISYLFFSSGWKLKDSILLARKGKPISGEMNSEEELYFDEEIFYKSEFYPNGNKRILKSFNGLGKEHGVWRYYLKNGELDCMVVYENGEWVKKI